jgi:N6-adenosine-specific RNA methylase IME4
MISINGTHVSLEKVSSSQLVAWEKACADKLPVGKRTYQVILADPPWDYDGKSVKLTGLVKYPTMTPKELMELPVGKLADPSMCVLFMWVTGPMLDVAIDVIRAWGFSYKTVFKVWLKRNSKAGGAITGAGWWTRPSVEFLLCATKGSGWTKFKTTNCEPQEFESARGIHSAKPPEIRAIVRRFFDVPRRIELFARDRAPGFDAWGLEIDGFFAQDRQKNGKK